MKSLISIRWSRQNRNTILVITNLGTEWPEVEKIQRAALLACRLLTFPHRTKGNELAHNPRFEKEVSYDTGCYLSERNKGCCISGKDHCTGKSHRKKRNAAKKRLNAVYMMCSASTGTGFPKQPQHCCPGLLMV